MELNGKKILFLGDSITEGSGTSGNEKTFCSIIAHKYGAYCVNYGIGGTRIARQSKPSTEERWNRNFCSRVLTMQNEADAVVVWTNRGFGLLEGTAVFLPCYAVIVGFTVLAHGKSRFAKGMTGRKLFRFFSVSFVERNSAIAVIHSFNGIVNFFNIISLIRNEGTIVYR